MSVALAATLHDADGRLYAQAERMLPHLRALLGAIAVQATHATQARTLALLARAGAVVQHEPPGDSGGYLRLGRPRRESLALALQTGAPHILFCDFDRALHWAERFPDELARVVGGLPARDLTVLGRTERAFATHPRAQRDTEAVINQVFASVSGRAWDVTAAARGMSRRAAAAVLEGCPEEGIGTDVAWPLHLQRAGGFDIGYLATEGLEFETADRYADAVGAAGGLAAWLGQIDADPRQWALRLDIARAEVAALLPYWRDAGAQPD